MQWTVGKKLYTCVGGLALTTIATISVGIYTQRRLSTDLNTIATKVAPALQDAEQISYVVEGIGSTMRDAIVVSVQHDAGAIEQDLRELNALEREFAGHVDELKAATLLPEAKILADECNVLIADVSAQSAEMAALLREFKTDQAASRVVRLEKLVQQCQEIAGKIAGLHTSELTRASTASQADERRGMILAVVLGLGAFAALAIVVQIVRTVVRALGRTVDTLTHGSRQVTTAATHLAESAQSLSQATTEQAASLEETSASLEEVAALIRTNANSSAQATELMTDMGHVVTDSNAGFVEMTASMDRIRDSSRRVAEIIKTIDDIAFQTNILALNAAVEAARAGEAGMGFAVVADEVRSLAQRAAAAAKDTSTLIEESIANARNGHEKVDTVARSIAAINQSVDRVQTLVAEVSRANAQQSKGIDQITHTVAQMERVTQTIAASAEESAAASEELNAQAEQSFGEVRLLRAMVVGPSHEHGAEDVPAVTTPSPASSTPQRRAA